MHTYITKDGNSVTVDRAMLGPKHSPGYWWHNESELGDDHSVWREVVAPQVANDTLFGYDRKEFMAKQYK